MYPLLLKPEIKDYIWGGTRLKTEYGYETDKEITAEAWVLSCHKDGPGRVINGEYAGKTLPEVLEIWGKAALGEKAAKFSYFPILIKLIDAKDKLSAQVHPDDEYALKNEGEYGKTEMWYVVDCDEGAELVYGFKEDISKEEFKRRITDNTLTDVFNFVPVNKGDLFFISAGTLHAIGGGILIAEVQQNSNSTYRVSDYGRLGTDGKPRPLHIEKAVDVTKTEKPVLPYGKVGKVTEIDGNIKRELASCEFFTSYTLKLENEYGLYNEKSFLSVLCLDGNADICYNGESLKLCKGGSLFIPAGFETKLCGKAELLISYI